MPGGRRLRGIEADVHNPNIACIFTLLNLCCGFYAMMMHKMSMNSMDNWALGALLCAFFCDFLDGYFARKKHLTSAFGERLDSLADLISFGTAPMFFALSARREWEIGLLFVCCLFLVCGAVRLARYDPLIQGKIFSGMPIPIAGLTLTASALTCGQVPWFELVPGVLGILMISDVPFLKASFADSKKWMPLGLGVLFVGTFVSSGDLALATLTFTLPYIGGCLVLAVYRDLQVRVQAMQKG